MEWIEEERGGVRLFRPSRGNGAVVAFSARGHAPEGEEMPTAFLARRLATALGLGEEPIHWGKQVHGCAAQRVVAAGPPAQAVCEGERDALATALPDIALVVQTADCVPILLASSGTVGAAHAGWRGSAKGVAGAAVAALRELGTDPSTLSVWIGPSIGPCCYEIGGEVAAQFAGDFLRTGCGGRFRLDLRAVNVAQLEAAGVPPEAISVFPECTRCGGEKFASWRRDGAAAGRMIALIARTSPSASPDRFTVP